MKHLCVVLIASWLSVICGEADGHVILSDSQLQLKSDDDNVEMYRKDGNGRSWLQMLLVFARESSTNQTTPITQDKPCPESEKATVCKDGFIRLESKKCYYFSTQQSTWYIALQVCQSMVSTLAYPMSADENTALVNHLNNNLNGTLGWWLGGSDEAKEGQWVWAHNKSPIWYTDWIKGEPYNANKNEHCLQYLEKEEWQWNDRICNDTYPFICQQ